MEETVETEGRGPGKCGEHSSQDAGAGWARGARGWALPPPSFTGHIHHVPPGCTGQCQQQSASSSLFLFQLPQ